MHGTLIGRESRPDGTKIIISMAEPDVSKSVKRLRNDFKFDRSISRDERRAEQLHYDREIAPRLQSITETYDRITKRRNDAEIAKRKVLELDLSIKRLKTANAAAEGGGAGLAGIEKRYVEIQGIIGNIPKLPDTDDGAGGLTPGRPRSIPEMRAEVVRARTLASEIGLLKAISEQPNRVDLRGGFDDIIALGDERVKNATTLRDKSTSLIAELENLSRFHHGNTSIPATDIAEDDTIITNKERYQRIFDVFTKTKSLPDLEEGVRQGNQELETKRSGITRRLKKVTELYAQVEGRLPILPTTEAAEEPAHKNVPFKRQAQTPVFVRSLYLKYLKLIDADNLEDPQFLERVGHTKAEADKAFKDMHGDWAEGKVSEFDKFAQKLYFSMLEYLTNERDHLDEQAGHWGIPTAVGADDQVSADDKANLKNKLPKD